MSNFKNRSPEQDIPDSGSDTPEVPEEEKPAEEETETEGEEEKPEGE